MTKREELTEKLNSCYAGHRESWLHMKPEDLVCLAASISSESYAVRCVTDNISKEDAEYLLNFKDPLIVLADMLTEYCDDQFGYYSDTVGDLLFELKDKGEALEYYELESDPDHSEAEIEM